MAEHKSELSGQTILNLPLDHYIEAVVRLGNRGSLGDVRVRNMQLLKSINVDVERVRNEIAAMTAIGAASSTASFDQILLSLADCVDILQSIAHHFAQADVCEPGHDGLN